MELRIPWELINHSQTITPVMERIFKEHGLDLRRHEVVKLEDDPVKKERILTVRRRTHHIT